MSRHDQQAIDDARDALDVIPAMLRRAYQEVLEPRGVINEIRSPSISHTMPLPSDPKGWDTYRWACDQLLAAMQILAPDYQLPPEVRDTWPPAPGRAALLVKAVGAYLTHPKPAATRRACGKIIPIRRHLHHVTGTVDAPAPPTCETEGCTSLQQNGRRCWKCTNHKRHHGAWPDIRHATS